MVSIAQITEKIINNVALENEWNYKLILLNDYREAEELFKKRSQALRELYAENVNLYSELRSYLTQPFDEELVGELYESMRLFILSGSQDNEIICEISEKLIDYYKSVGNLEKAITTTVIYAVSFYDYFSRLNANSKRKETVIDSLKWVISNRDKYVTFEDYKTQVNMLSAYQQLILMDIAHARETKGNITCWDLVYEVLDFWNRPEIQSATIQLQPAANVVQSIKTNVLMEMEVGFEITGDQQENYIRLLEDYYADIENSEDWYDRIVLERVDTRIKYAKNEISEMEAYKIYKNIIKNLPKTDWENDPEESNRVLMLFVFMYGYLIERMEALNMTYAQREENVDDLMLVFNRIVMNMPYHYKTTYISDLYRHLFAMTVPNLSSIDKFEVLMKRLMLNRQPFTYLHSEMVAKISVTIAQAIMENNPLMYRKLPNLGNASERDIKECADFIYETVERCARMHDLGKCDVATLIMRQTRKITDEEFECIQNHSVSGANYIKSMVTLDKTDATYIACRDVMVGHHKTYDGRGGYPAQYDNTKADYRLLVDIITIADSIDAATDSTGRNYAAKKGFLQLLEELKAQAGSRYNPEIVDIIASDSNLISKLTEMTEDKRNEYIYEVYKNLKR